MNCLSCKAPLLAGEGKYCQNWRCIVADVEKEPGKKRKPGKKKSWIDEARELRDKALTELEYMDDLEF